MRYSDCSVYARRGVAGKIPADNRGKQGNQRMIPGDMINEIKEHNKLSC